MRMREGGRAMRLGVNPAQHVLESSADHVFEEGEHSGAAEGCELGRDSSLEGIDRPRDVMREEAAGLVVSVEIASGVGAEVDDKARRVSDQDARGGDGEVALKVKRRRSNRALASLIL